MLHLPVGYGIAFILKENISKKLPVIVDIVVADIFVAGKSVNETCHIFQYKPFRNISLGIFSSRYKHTGIKEILSDDHLVILTNKCVIVILLRKLHVIIHFLHGRTSICI